MIQGENFRDWLKTAKTAKVFPLESFAVYGTSVPGCSVFYCVLTGFTSLLDPLLCGEVYLLDLKYIKTLFITVSESVFACICSKFLLHKIVRGICSLDWTTGLTVSFVLYPF